MSGTAFSPGGDGLWKAKPQHTPTFPYGGVLLLGSDFGDEIGLSIKMKTMFVFLASPVVFWPKRATEFNNVTATKAIAFIPTFDFV
jgi:hypothetical protein